MGTSIEQQTIAIPYHSKTLAPRIPWNPIEVIHIILKVVPAFIIRAFTVSSSVPENEAKVGINIFRLILVPALVLGCWERHAVIVQIIKIIQSQSWTRYPKLG